MVLAVTALTITATGVLTDLAGFGRAAAGDIKQVYQAQSQLNTAISQFGEQPEAISA